MTIVRVVKSWSSPDLMRQTPGCSGVWGNCRFVSEPTSRCDYLMVLNHLPEKVTVDVPPENVWCLVQEPPEPIFRWLEKGFPYYQRVFTQDTRLRGAKIVHSHGSLPWHVDKSYDELRTMPRPEKMRSLSWITSNLGIHRGHRRRLRLLARLLEAGVPFDLFGRGFSPLPDKWDGLAPYRYAIAAENHICPEYWTEKIADCFLAWTMPIYFGATNIADSFPPESFVQLDINDPDAPRRVAEIVRSNLAEKNRDAIAEARRRVLEEHNFFPRIARLIAEDQAARPASQSQRLDLPAIPDLSQYYLKHNPIDRFSRSVRRRLGLVHS
ncbi:MAG: glycosyltransferase family 10 [Terrimicrobiaceae bacterium]|nr:glycosyltransferase family 10 [Terrimicrobiaceae bacterium]